MDKERIQRITEIFRGDDDKYCIEDDFDEDGKPIKTLLVFLKEFVFIYREGDEYVGTYNGLMDRFISAMQLSETFKGIDELIELKEFLVNWFDNGGLRELRDCCIDLILTSDEFKGLDKEKAVLRAIKLANRFQEEGRRTDNDEDLGYMVEEIFKGEGK